MTDFEKIESAARTLEHLGKALSTYVFDQEDKARKAISDTAEAIANAVKKAVQNIP